MTRQEIFERIQTLHAQIDCNPTGEEYNELWDQVELLEQKLAAYLA